MARTKEQIASWKTSISALAGKIRSMSEEEKQAFIGDLPIMNPDGHVLSVYNQCFILTQYPEATVVGGFGKWKKAGRTVRKGQHSIGSIYVPIGKPKATDDTEGKAKGVRFILKSVFDITQTEALTDAS